MSWNRRRVALLLGSRSLATQLAEALQDWEVEHCGAARDALARVARRRGRIDLAAVDCAGLGTSADAGCWLTVLPAIQTKYPWVPIVGVITARVGPQQVVQAVRAGARDFVILPLDTAEIRLVADRLLGRRARRDPPDTNAAIAATIAFLERHYDAPLSIETVAKIAAMSRWHFFRTFRKQTGMTFGAYLRDYRIRQAVELLRQNRLSITQVAHEVGFYDLSHFERVFRRRYGCTPREFRDRHRAQRPEAL